MIAYMFGLGIWTILIGLGVYCILTGFFMLFLYCCEEVSNPRGGKDDR